MSIHPTNSVNDKRSLKIIKIQGIIYFEKFVILIFLSGFIYRKILLSLKLGDSKPSIFFANPQIMLPRLFLA